MLSSSDVRTQSWFRNISTRTLSQIQHGLEKMLFSCKSCYESITQHGNRFMIFITQDVVEKCLLLHAEYFTKTLKWISFLFCWS